MTKKPLVLRKIFTTLAVGVAALLLTSVPGFAATTTAGAEQHPIGGSGIHGDIHFVDDGSTLTVDGTATGLTPHTPYFSLVYTLGSHPGGIAGPQPFPPTGNPIPPCAAFNAAGATTVTTTQMVLGLWQNNNDGTGTLHTVKSMTGNSQDPLFLALGLGPVLQSFGYVFGGDSYAPIGTWRTVSIRDASNNFTLVACGEVH